MISNRKGLAFTSKTPGKTSEFNYFDAKGKIALNNEKHRFYLVDLPGVGYAEVDKDLKASWLALLRSYVTSRTTLKVLFHLVDSRHGLLPADEDCLSLLPSLPKNVQYVIIFTKVDKLRSGIRKDLLQSVHKAIKLKSGENVVKQVPIVYTSADSGLGGVKLWSVMLDALALPESIEVDGDNASSSNTVFDFYSDDDNESLIKPP